MSSVSSVNPGVADLLQTLSSINSPVLSSQPVVSALKSAPTSDIVQMSMEATQLQGIDAMFGISASPNTNMTNLFASLEGASTSPADATASTSPPAGQLANYQSALQAELTQGLFGTTGTTSLTGSLFNLTG